MKKYLLLLWAFWGMLCYAQKEYKVISPDRSISLELFRDVSGGMGYRLTVDRTSVIAASGLGFRTPEGKICPAVDWSVSDADFHQVDTVWRPLWGKRSVVADRYSEVRLRLADDLNPADQLDIVARAYDDGVAFRYEVPEESGLQVKGLECTAFNFAGDYTAWFYNGERHNIGPERLSETDGERLPVMTVKAADNLYLALHEACLAEGFPLRLKSSEGSCAFKAVSQPMALRPGYKSAWRVVFCGNTPGELVDSHLLELLNPDPDGGMDFSWVKPGVALWDWRINGAQWGGFTYSMNYPSWIRMVDFAAEQGFAYLVLDANWYGPEFESDSDPVKGEKANDVRRLIRYAKQKGIGIWLYLNDVAGRNYSLEETLKQYEAWGASGVKYGFMTGTDEEKNIKTRNITEVCARHKLLVDFHDYPVHPYGQMRTWPNAITREYCKAQLDGHDIFYPKTFVTSVFVNMIAGPVDMNNGMFDLRQGKTTRVDNNMEVPSTIVSEAARTLITFSGATILPDIPEYYRKYPALLSFLSAQKMPWRESKTLDGRIGEYIVMMREAADGAILIGAATGEEARSLQIPLSFLDEGSYEAEIVEDGETAHYLTERETCQVRKQDVTRHTVLNVRLAPGGGACIRIWKSSGSAR